MPRRGCDQRHRSPPVGHHGTDVCLALPAAAAITDGSSSYAIVDASGGFSRPQVDMGALRMLQTGAIPVGYSNVVADNAASEAEAVYAALGIPFAGQVYGMKQYFSQL